MRPMEPLESRLLMTTLYWDPNGTAAGIGGSGTWDTTAAVWTTDINGLTGHQVWDSTHGDVAVFASTSGTGGTVSINPTVSGVSAAGLTFSANGYTITTPANKALTLTGSGTLDVASGVTATLSSTLAGTAGFTKTGLGTLTLSAGGTTSNSYTGSATVSQGTLSLGGGFAGDGAIRGNLSVASGATLNQTQSNIIVNSSLMTINGTWEMTGKNEAIGGLSGSGSVTNMGGLTLDLGTTVANFSGTIAGTGGINVRTASSGSQKFSGAAANTYTGTTTVNAGKLYLSKNSGINAIGGNLTIGDPDSAAEVGQLGANNQIPDTAILTINKTGVFQTNGFSDTVGMVQGDGILENGSNINSTLTVGSSNNLSGSFAGTIRNNNGQGATGILSINKNGTGTWTLSGTNIYTGETRVNNGLLRILSANALGSTAGDTLLNDVTGTNAALEVVGDLTLDESFRTTGDGISGGGVLRIDGNTTITGKVTLVSGGGNSTFNILNNGSLNLTGTVTNVDNWARTLFLDGTGGTYFLPHPVNNTTGGGRLDINHRNSGTLYLGDQSGSASVGNLSVSNGKVIVFDPLPIGSESESGTGDIDHVDGGAKWFSQVISVGDLVPGETSNSFETYIEEVDPSWVEGDWKAAVIANVTGTVTIIKSDGTVLAPRAFPGNSKIGLGSELKKTPGFDAGPFSDSDKLIGYEDYTDNDYDDGIASVNARSVLLYADLDNDSNNDGQVDASDDKDEDKAPGNYVAVGGELSKLVIQVPVLESDINELQWRVKINRFDKIGLFHDSEGDEAVVMSEGDPTATDWTTLAAGQPKLEWFVKGLGASESQGDVSITLEVADLSEVQPKLLMSDTVVFTVIAVDLDVDSDNNNGFGSPDRSDTEEALEDDSQALGKLIATNDTDWDVDGIPDFADGISAGSDFVSLAGTTNNMFVPIVLQVSDAVDLSKANLKLTYHSADPAEVSEYDGVYYSNGGQLRLWTRDGTSLRNGRDVANNAGGNFIPSTTFTGASGALQRLFQGEHTVTIYLEATTFDGSASEYLKPETIEVGIDPDGYANGERYIAVDLVQVSVVRSKGSWTSEALASAGIGSFWDPAAGFPVNKATVQKVYYYYATLFVDDPIKFSWAGLANMAGRVVYNNLKANREEINAAEVRVAVAESMLLGPAVIDPLRAEVRTLKGVETLFLEMQKAIFLDIGWQHEAYRSAGIGSLELLSLADDRQIAPDTSSFGIAIWHNIDGTAAPQGNLAMANREQFILLQPYFNSFSIPFSYLTSFLTSSPVPGGLDFYEYSSLSLITDPSNLNVVTNFSNRWSWIENDMWPKWIGLTPEERADLVNQPLED